MNINLINGKLLDWICCYLFVSSMYSIRRKASASCFVFVLFSLNTLNIRIANVNANAIRQNNRAPEPWHFIVELQFRK